MPITKSALIRYQVLDKCFRNTGRIYFIEDLVEEINKVLQEIDPNCSVKKRQVIEDINFMESSEGFSIDLQRVRDGKRVFYRYSDPSFSINNLPLKQEELDKIKAAIDILSRFEGMPQFDWVYEVIPIVQHKLGLVRKTDKPIVSFDFNRDLKGLEFFGVLFNSILNEVVLRVEYKPYISDQSYQLIFHPYYLKEYNNRWFVIGLNQEQQNPFWVLALDRIVSIESTSLSYLNCDTDWEEYFYDVIGVTRPTGVEPIEIKLLFSPERAPYIISKPLHMSQKVKYIDDMLEVRIKVVPNKELMALLLSFCPHVQVVEPLFLRDEFVSILNQSLTPCM